MPKVMVLRNVTMPTSTRPSSSMEPVGVSALTGKRSEGSGTPLGVTTKPPANDPEPADASGCEGCSAPQDMQNWGEEP